MARRMILEGAKVKAVLELLPYSSGLKRNIVQCLNDYDIPLKFSHTITQIHGQKRLEGVTYAQVDENRRVLKETEQYIPCDTLLLSVWLIPENELSRKADVKLSPVTSGPVVNNSLETSNEGIFACGNVLHVHDLVDNVTLESENAGRNAASYINGQLSRGGEITVIAVEGVRYTVPQFINPEAMESSLTVRFRVGDVFRNAYISVYFDEERVIRRRKNIITPGEMEEVRLTPEMFKTRPDTKSITFKIERS
jgi:hypothetical protein